MSAAAEVMAWVVMILALLDLVVMTVAARRPEPSLPLLYLTGALWLAFLVALPVTAVLAWLTGDVATAVLFGGLWLFALLRMWFGGPRGRRRWRALVARVRDAGHRLVVQPAGAPA